MGKTKNLNKVLDEGREKNLREIIEMKYEWEHSWAQEFIDLYDRDENQRVDNLDPNVLYEECTKYRWLWYTLSDAGHQQAWRELKIKYNIVPFVPFICFNISPNWPKGKRQMVRTRMVLFEEVIKDWFARDNRWTRMDYVLESGSNADHLHAHIVARINPELEKTIITQQYKGNLANGFRKCWMKHFQVEGMGGILKGQYAIQTILIRKQEYLQDKMDYLVEDLKPEDHKNLLDLGIRGTIYF
jgi:hypothetical protein